MDYKKNGIPFRFTDRKIAAGTEGRVLLRKGGSSEKTEYFIERADTVENADSVTQLNAENLNGMLEYVENTTTQAVEIVQETGAKTVTTVTNWANSTVESAKKIAEEKIIAAQEAAKSASSAASSSSSSAASASASASSAQADARAAAANAIKASTDAIDALGQAADAKAFSLSANEKSAEALINATNALSNSTEAKTASTAARADATQAKTNATSALTIAAEIERRANSGEFNGVDGVSVQADGTYGFQIIDGNLILGYSGDTAPDFGINANGELTFNY